MLMQLLLFMLPLSMKDIVLANFHSSIWSLIPFGNLELVATAGSSLQEEGSWCRSESRRVYNFEAFFIWKPLFLYIGNTSLAPCILNPIFNLIFSLFLCLVLDVALWCSMQSECEFTLANNLKFISFSVYIYNSEHFVLGATLVHHFSPSHGVVTILYPHWLIVASNVRKRQKHRLNYAQSFKLKFFPSYLNYCPACVH